MEKSRHMNIRKRQPNSRDYSPQESAMKQKNTVNLIGGVLLITLFAKVLGIVRESLQARAFGTLTAAELYTTANNNTIYLFTTVAYALCVAAVPIFSETLQKNREEGYRTAGNLICITLLASVVVTALWVGLSYTPLMSQLWSGSGESLGQLGSYFRIMSLTLPVIVLTYLLVGLFQAQEHFTLQGSMSIPYNLFLVLFLLIFASQWGVKGYVAAVAVAWLLQFAMTIPYAIKEKLRFYPSLNLRAPYVRRFFKTALVTVLTTAVFLFCYLMDAAAAGHLSGSTVSAFYYADKLFAPLSTTLIYSISTVMFPKFSQQYSKLSHSDYLSYVCTVLRNTLMLILPASVILSVFGVPIVRVLFEGGQFTAASTAETGAIFMFYALGMAGFCSLDLLNKAYYTMNRTLKPLLVNAGILLCNFILNAVLAPIMGSSGIALATAISMTLGGIVLAFLLLGGGKRQPISGFLKSTAATIAMGAVLFWAASLALTGLESKLILIVKCCGLGAAAAVFYVLLSAVLGQEEMRAALEKYLGRKRKSPQDQ